MSTDLFSKRELRATLSDPRKKEFFRNFLEKELNHENLLFWLDVERYKKLHRYIDYKLASFNSSAILKSVSSEYGYTSSIIVEDPVEETGESLDSKSGEPLSSLS